MEPTPQELQAQVVRLLATALEEVFSCDLCNISAADLIDNILYKSETALDTMHRQELIIHLKTLIG